MCHPKLLNMVSQQLLLAYVHCFVWTVSSGRLNNVLQHNSIMSVVSQGYFTSQDTVSLIPVINELSRDVLNTLLADHGWIYTHRRIYQLYDLPGACRHLIVKHLFFHLFYPLSNRLTILVSSVWLLLISCIYLSHVCLLFSFVSWEWAQTTSV